MAAELPRQINDELKTIATEMVEDFDKTTKTWNHKVEFEVVAIADGYSVSTDDEIWHMVDAGTPPHIITAVRAPALAWRSPFRAKTKAHTIASYQGFVGNEQHRALEVHHPGTEAREFTQTIVERWQPHVTPRLRKRLDAGIEAAGL